MRLVRTVERRDGPCSCRIRWIDIRRWRSFATNRISPNHKRHQIDVKSFAMFILKNVPIGMGRSR